MSTLDREALSGLTETVRSLLPPVADPVLAPELRVRPERVDPTGLGGLAGISAAPRGEIIGRRLRASVLVTLRSSDEDRLGGAISDVTGALVTGDRAGMRARGLLDVEVARIGERSEAPPNFEQDVAFSVLYEHLCRPSQDEGVIGKIPVAVDVDAGGSAPARVLVESRFETDPMAMFEPVEDPQATRERPARWRWNDAEPRLEQASAIYGGLRTATVRKPGTYLVLRTGAALLPVRDFILDAELGSTSPEGIGVVFRWQDVDNFLFFYMQGERHFRLLGKKVAGEFRDLTPRVLDAAHGFEPGVTSRVRIRVEGTRVEVDVDGRRALSGEDGSITAPGRVGFMTHRNDQAFFHRIYVTALDLDKGQGR